MEGLITELLGRLGSWGVLAALVFSIGFWLFADLHRQEGRGWWIAQLRHNSFERRYRALMGRLLDQVDAFFAARSRPTRPRRDLWQHFDDGAAVLCLKASWGVSACSMLLVLVATGQGSRIAHVPVIYSDEAMVRWIYGAVLAGLLVAALSVARIEGFWRRMAARIAVLVPLAIGLDALDPAAFRHRDSLLFSILAPLVGFVGLSLRRAESLLLMAPTLIYSVLLPVQLGLLALHRRAVPRIGRTLSLSLLIVATSVVTTVTSGLVTLPPAALDEFMALLAEWMDAAALQPGRMSFILDSVMVFFIVLPILMGMSYFLSLSLTRLLLRRGLARGIALHAAIDVFAALALLVLQIVLLLAVVATFGLVSGQGAGFARAVFADMEAAPQGYWWLVAPVLLTLVPTVLHAGIGAFSLFTLITSHAGGALAAALQSGDVVRGRLAGLSLALISTVALCLPLYMLSHLLSVLPLLVQFLVDLAFSP